MILYRRSGNMVLPLKMAFLFRLALLAAVSAQLSTASDSIVTSCRRSQIQHDLPADLVFNMFVRFSAIDQHGNAVLITDSFATQCGYKISQDSWGNMTFRISLYSCYVQIKNDTYFTVPVKIEISSRPDMVGAVSYLKTTSCPYSWSPREMVCETNYMEVSVRRKIPEIAEKVLQNEPEDWASAFSSAVSGLLSIWQIVFHKSSTQKTTMLIDAAQNLGYGVNTTESRTLMRSSYNATETVPQMIGGVLFSTLRATLFYKQRWFIYLVDNAVACPVDDVVFSPGLITWTIPKNIPPLLIGAKIFQRSSYQFGLDLLNIKDDEILARKYDITDGVEALTVRIPIGADGGFYKSHVVNREHGVVYNIKPFIENVWIDDAWGVTKYTIIKDILTPFEPRPPVITNDTIPQTLIFNVTIGTFLEDVELINITTGGDTRTVSQAQSHGFEVSPIKYTNGSVGFVLKVPFTDPQVSRKTFPGGFLFTLNVTFGFNIIPYNETFTTSTTIESFLEPPNIVPCARSGSMLTTTIGNLHPSWNVYINNILATTNNQLILDSNRSSITIQVSSQSELVMSEAVGTSLMTAIPMSITDGTGARIYSMVLNCEVEKLVDCSPEGNIKVTVRLLIDIPGMDLSMLRLRDPSCGPTTSDGNIAYFVFPASSCRTTRTFEDNLMIYYNEITYYSTEIGKLLFVMNVTCNYIANGTVEVEYGYKDNPTPSPQSALASLNLVLRLSKDISYTVFYEDGDYPVVKYLREPLYFEVELLSNSDPKLELFLDTCWATTSPDMNSSPTWPIVSKSCEFEELYQTIFHPVALDSRVKLPSHFKRFEVKTFTFMEGDKPYTGAIYFHCDVIICDNSNLSSDPMCSGVGSCIPAKQRAGRSINTNADNLRLISSRAVVLLAPKVESYAAAQS
ncbi:uncharacterized protein [Pyxicephalus adspersus]|uniref:uncharacterized protein n=1 Tax=Pyxicephalus adspersus TaxID=30357 RepID=UPI003B5A36F9